MRHENVAQFSKGPNFHNMPRRRKRPTLQQLQTRFIREAVQWWIFALFAGIGAYAINTMPCMALRIAPVAPPCEPAFPLADAAWALLALIGCAMGAWRFYRDHYCGDIWRDFDGV